MTELENLNPSVYTKCDERPITPNEVNNLIVDDFDVREIFDLIRNINDPEHPLSLEELHVLQLNQVTLNNNDVTVLFTPTISHCSMATLIGLSIRVKLLHTLPSRFKVTVEITPGSHVSEDAINKQLKDKERVAAALENIHLKSVINQCIAGKN